VRPDQPGDSWRWSMDRRREAAWLRQKARTLALGGPGRELVSLCLDDYDRHRALLKVRAETSKSGRDRWVPLSPIGQRVLDYYLDHERRALVDALALDECGPLFLSESLAPCRRPSRCGRRGACRSVRRATTAARSQLRSGRPCRR